MLISYTYVCTCEYAYLRIPHVKLIYSETPCFGENKRTRKVTQNTGKYNLRRATKVTISHFRGWRRHKITALGAVFFGGGHGNKWCAPFLPGHWLLSYSWTRFTVNICSTVNITVNVICTKSAMGSTEHATLRWAQQIMRKQPALIFATRSVPEVG